MTRWSTEQHDGAQPDEPASLAARWIAALVLLFLADAAQVLLLVPGQTRALFAWPIQPAVTAAILGSAYVAGSYFFIRVVTGTPWHLVAGGFPPVIVFVWMAGVATLLHLDRLNDSGLPLIAWVALYVVTPLLVPVIYLSNRSRARPPPAGRQLQDGMRLLLGLSGGAVLIAALVAFVSPATIIETWPWQLTPLTLRVVAGVFGLYGTVGITVALSGGAAAARIPLESQAIGYAVVLFAVLGAGATIEWENVVAPVFAAAVAVLLTIAVAARASAGEPAPQAGRRVDVRRRIAGVLALAALGVGAVVLLVSATGSSEPAEPGVRFDAGLAPVPTNRVVADGRATVRLDGTLATVTVNASGLLDVARHLMHIHAGARGTCPPASAARAHRGHRTIATLDGGAFYGKAMTALTTHGDTSKRSILAFDHFPATGAFRYSRSIRLTPQVAELVRLGNAVILVHGIDYNGNAVYDGVLDRSDLDRKHFGEATAPALCGPLVAEPERRGSSQRTFVAALHAP
jgi:hypothetical protein